MLDIKPNDVICFLITFLGTKRDKLISIEIGKATNWQQLDDDLSMIDSIMLAW